MNHLKLWALHAAMCAFLSTPLLLAQQPRPQTPSPFGVRAKAFDSPQQAADALIDAAETLDVHALEEMFASNDEDSFLSGEYPQDRKRASEFTALAREKKSVFVDPKNANRAFVVVGHDDWQLPDPLVKQRGKWSFDAGAGRKEILRRRIQANELDAVEICHKYVLAQYKYAASEGEYAERIISRPGKKDGLAWQNHDGSWSGPIGEAVARAIEQGYSTTTDPYHGYFFKILKGQGPAAPLGEKDYSVKGIKVGGFALIAAPAEYGITGVRSFIVSHFGPTYEKDFGPRSLQEFIGMERFNPDSSWKLVLSMGKAERFSPASPPALKSR